MAGAQWDMGWHNFYNDHRFQQLHQLHYSENILTCVLVNIVQLSLASVLIQVISIL